MGRRALGRGARRRRAGADRLPGVGRLSQADRRKGLGARRARRPGSRSRGARRRLSDLADLRALGRTPSNPIEPDRTSSNPLEPDRTDECRRDHLHVGRHRRSEGRRHHPSQHPREHRPDRARGDEVPEGTGARSFRSAFSISCRSATCSARRWRRSFHPCCQASSYSFTATTPTRSSSRSNRAACPCSSACRRCSMCSAITCSGSCPRPRRPRARPGTGSNAGGAIGACTGCSAGSSGASSSARRRSIPSWRRSGPGSATSLSRATG